LQLGFEGLGPAAWPGIYIPPFYIEADIFIISGVIN